MDIGFIGLGTMGEAMANNLIEAGHKIVAYKRNTTVTNDAQAGSSISYVSSPAEVTLKSEILITMLANDDAVEQVYFGEQGILAGCRSEGAKLRYAIDCSTIGLELSLRLAKALEAAGIDKLEAPVAGSKPQAEEGSLTFIVGGSKEVLREVEPVLLHMGKKAIYLGGHGAGAIAKLAVNMMLAAHVIALAESLAMVRKAGLDADKFLEVVAGGGARSAVAEVKGPKMIAHDFTPQFMTELMHKDLGLAARLADSMNLPLPAAASVKQAFQMAYNAGIGKEDMSAVIKCYEQWANL